MGKYKDDTKVVEAFKWTGGCDKTKFPEWDSNAIATGRVKFLNEGTKNVSLFLYNEETAELARSGDYIVMQDDGKILALEESNFLANYEKEV